MSPLDVIKMFHEQFLSFVCQGNMLGCLAYKGGPFTKCDDCGVFEGVVPCVVQPENGECLIKQKVKCPSSSCFFKFDVNKLLRWEEVCAHQAVHLYSHVTLCYCLQWFFNSTANKAYCTVKGRQYTSVSTTTTSVSTTTHGVPYQCC